MSVVVHAEQKMQPVFLAACKPCRFVGPTRSTEDAASRDVHGHERTRKHERTMRELERGSADT